ncbi:MAG TPA: glycosyltransferase family 4 protein [Candidatus Baltobacteraceae bacterium]
MTIERFVRKRVVVITQFYPPEPCAASNRVSALVRYLAATGHSVTVLTGMPSFPAGVVSERYRGMRSHAERDGDARIERFRAYVASGRGARLFSWITLAIALAWRLLTMRARIDAIVVSYPPITLALPALVGALRHRARLFVDVRDVFPDMGVKLGVWKPAGIAARAVGLVVDALYARAELVVACTPSARDEIAARGVALAKIALAPNGFEFPKTVRTAIARVPHAGFVTVYAGNMGLAASLDVVLDAAKLLANDSEFRFVLAGGGADAARLLKRIETEGIDNLTYAGILTRDESLELLREADASIVALHPGITDAVPSKLFDALAVGCPVIVSASGESAKLVSECGAGLQVLPHDAGALAAAIRQARADADRLRLQAQAAQTYVREHYDRNRIMERLAEAVVAGV